VVIVLHDVTGLCHSVFDVANHLHGGMKAASVLSKAVKKVHLLGRRVDLVILPPWWLLALAS
jgi:hypothetical protein